MYYYTFAATVSLAARYWFLWDRQHFHGAGMWQHTGFRCVLGKEQPVLLRGQMPCAKYLPIAPKVTQGPPPQGLAQALLPLLISNTSFSQERRIQRCHYSLSTLIRSLLLPDPPEAEMGKGGGL